MGFSLSSLLGSAGAAGKAKLVCLDSGDLSIGAVQFNPSEFSYSRSVNWSGTKEAPKDGGGGGGGGAATITTNPWGVMQYTSGNSDTLSVQLLFDESELRDSWKEWVPVYAPPPLPGKLKSVSAALSPGNQKNVLEKVQAVHRLTLPLIKGTTKDTFRPPYCAFVWGPFQFQGAVTSVNVDFKLFDADGTPRRAMVNVSMSGRALGSAASVEELETGISKALEGKAKASSWSSSTGAKDFSDLLSVASKSWK